MERFLNNAGTRIWSISTGKGTPLILCNGGPGCDDYLGPVAAMIDDICQVVRFEPRGCGRSDRDKRYDLETTIDDVEFIRREYGFEQIIIAGHSAGVDVALAYTLKYPHRVTNLIGLAGGRIVNDREWSRIYKENQEQRGEDTGGRIYDSDPDVNTIGNATWRQYITRPTLLREIADLQCPATFIAASDDIRPNWPAQQLANLLPHGKYVEIEGAAHYIWLSKPDALRAAIRIAIGE